MPDPTQHGDVAGMVYLTVSGAEVEVLEWAGDHARVLYLRTGEERTLPVESLQPRRTDG